MIKPFLECGKIVSTHGIHGEVKVQPWCDTPEFLLEFTTLYMDKGSKKCVVEQSRIHKGMVMLKLAGINTMDEAVTLRGKVLYIDRVDAPPDQEGVFFVQDLLGIQVVDADTQASYGTLTDVFRTGANDVYEITGEDGVKRLAPAIKDVVIRTDPHAGIMEIRPLKGLFEDAD